MRSPRPSNLRVARKKRAARVLLALWVGVVVALPLLHSLDHEFDHIHGPFGHIARVDWSGFLLGKHHSHGHGHGHSHGHGHAHGHEHELARHGHDHPTDEERDESNEQDESEAKSARRDQHDPSHHGSGSAEHLDVWFQLAPLVVLPTAIFSELALCPHWLPRSRKHDQQARRVDGPRAPPV